MDTLEVAAQVPMAVQVVTVESRSIPELVEVPGETRAIDAARISAKVMGVIEAMPIALGQSVQRGELLLRISAPEISARVDQAEAQVNQARRALAREQSLLAKDASTSDLVNTLIDQAAAAEAGLREAEAMLGYTELRAPFDGVVARKYTEVGSQASPGAALLDFERAGGFEIVVGAPDSLARGLNLGDDVAVEIAQSGNRFNAEVRERSQASNPSTRTILVFLSVPQDVSTRSGQYVRVFLPNGMVSKVMVPESTVNRLGQMESVFVFSDDKAMLRLVTTGTRLDGMVEILSGLDVGELLVVVPPTQLREGQTLEIQP